MKKHEDILRRAHLLAQAANEAAEAITKQIPTKTEINSSLLPSKNTATTTTTVTMKKQGNNNSKASNKINLPQLEKKTTIPTIEQNKQQKQLKSPRKITTPSESCQLPSIESHHMNQPVVESIYSSPRISLPPPQFIPTPTPTNINDTSIPNQTTTTIPSNTTSNINTNIPSITTTHKITTPRIITPRVTTSSPVTIPNISTPQVTTPREQENQEIEISSNDQNIIESLISSEQVKSILQESELISNENNNLPTTTTTATASTAISNDQNKQDIVSKYIEQYLKSRGTVVNRNNAPSQVLCYLCCAEFGTASLLIHQKTCWSKQ